MSMHAMCEAEIPGTHFCSKQGVESVLVTEGFIVWQLTTTDPNGAWIDGPLGGYAYNCYNWSTKETVGYKAFRLSQRGGITFPSLCDLDLAVARCE